MTASQGTARAPANGWLLDFGHGLRAAVGMRVLLHLIDDPKLFVVPCSPPYCRHVAFWEGRALPVMEMAARLGKIPLPPRLLAVACYLDPLDGTPRFGAFSLASAPIAIAVSDQAACALPEQAGWRGLTASCFQYQGVPVPILHLARIFAAPAA